MTGLLQRIRGRRDDAGLPWDGIEAVLRSQAPAPGPVRVQRLGGWLSSGQVFRATVECGDGRPADFLVKRSPYARLERAGLLAVQRRLEGTALAGTVPRLVACFEPESVVVTDFQTGTTNLGAALLRAALPGSTAVQRGELLRAARAFGLWLGGFQAAMDDGQTAPLDTFGDLPQRVQELDVLGEGRKQQVLDALARESERLGPVPVVLAHGDLAPRNVLVTAGGGVCVVDWEMVPARPAPFLFDLHHCLGVLRKPRGLLDGGGIGGHAAAELLAGYRERAPFAHLIDRAWRPTRLLALLMLLSRQVRAQRRAPGWSRLTGRNAHIRQLAEEIVDELEQCRN